MDVTADLVYLMGCALRGLSPSRERVAAMNMDALRLSGAQHKIASMSAMALELCRPSPGEVIGESSWRKWARLRDDAIRRSVLFDVERERHCAFLAANGIKYMPLKGILLQKLYPRFGMREMADNDILFDSAFREAVRDHMLADGYRVVSYEEGFHDCYFKEPVYNFEFHVALFSGITNRGALERYYADVWDRAIPEENEPCRYRLPDDDFYLYFAAHAYKHFDAKGIGLRILADDYVLRRACGDGLDWAYIDRELEKTGVLAFDRTLRSLSSHLFDDPETVSIGALPEDERWMLGYFSGSGAYGVEENLTLNRLRHIRAEGYEGGAARARFVLGRLFPSREHMRVYMSAVARHPLLLPGAYVWRMAKAAFSRRESIRKELEIARRAWKKEK